MSDDIEAMMIAALKHREEQGRHLHHRDCIHNLPPEKQVEVRGKTVEWWTAIVGPLPEQITSDQWECEPPDWGRQR